jgi:FkbM family methyltransferase
MSAARKFLKKLVIGNPLTRPLYKRRYERHLRRVLTENCGASGVQAEVMPDAFAIRKGDNVMKFGFQDAIHGGYMAQHFDTYFSATQSTKVNGLNVVDYSMPKVHTLANGLQFEFASFPEEADAIVGYTAWYQPKEGDLIFDLGANVGISVYHFSKMVGKSGRVVCFEPDPISLGYLRRNIKRHGLENVTVVESAVGGADGTVEFYAEGTLGSGMANLLGRDPVGDVITVPLVSLRTAFATYGVPSLCKVDIEGAEVAALDAAVDLIAPLKINFVVDTTHMVEGSFTDQRVEAIFKRAGYTTETVKADFLTTYARPA